MTILRKSDCRRMPWKNGGGETTEIAVFPPGASMETFGWRVSMATVAADGPFSVFPGIDRTLSILEGNGMALEIEGRAAVTLTRDTAPLTFPADAATTAALIHGPITDLNVMTRRGRFVHAVERLVIDGKRSIEAGNDVVLLLALGDARSGVKALGPLDTMYLDGETTIETDTPVTIYLIRIDAA